MSTDVSISDWIHGAKVDDSTALQALWEVYFPKLVALARKRLRDGSRRVSDEEDVAISVMESFFRAAREGRFADLADRDDLWRLLLRMTVRKAIDHHRRDQRAKRARGQVRGESVLEGGGVGAIQAVVGAEPTPEMAALLTEETTRLLNLLGDEELSRIALAKLEGYQNAEVADQLGCSQRTIERRLDLIRRKWAREHEF